MIITLISGAMGMGMGVIRDAGRTKTEDHQFDWKIFLGERLWQLVGRAAITIGAVTPKVMEFVGPVIGSSGIPADPAVIGAGAAFITGLYSDRLLKNLLDLVETRTEEIPGLSQLFKIGKKHS